MTTHYQTGGRLIHREEAYDYDGFGPSTLSLPLKRPCNPLMTRQSIGGGFAVCVCVYWGGLEGREGRHVGGSQGGELI